MKVKIIKPHPFYKGTVEVEDERAKYLISVGIAEEVKGKKSDAKDEKEEKESKPEKMEHKGDKHEKEKQVLKPGELPKTKGHDVTMANVKKEK